MIKTNDISVIVKKVVEAVDNMASNIGLNLVIEVVPSATGSDMKTVVGTFTEKGYYIMDTVLFSKNGSRLLVRLKDNKFDKGVCADVSFSNNKDGFDLFIETIEINNTDELLDLLLKEVDTQNHVLFGEGYPLTEHIIKSLLEEKMSNHESKVNKVKVINLNRSN